MSDIADRADAVSAVEGAGGSFVNRNRCAPSRRASSVCRCGARPVYAPAAGAQGPDETLTCPACGLAAGPSASRAALVREFADLAS